MVVRAIEPLSTETRELLADVAEILRQLAVDVLNATPQGAPSTSRISVGDPADVCCGSTTIILRRVVPVQAGNGCDPTLWAADWRLDVARDCPPNLGSVYNILPNPAAEREADTLLMFDAVSIFAQFAVLAQKQVTQRVRLPSRAMSTGCVRFDAGQLEPYTSGDCSGWRFDFRIGLAF